MAIDCAPEKPYTTPDGFYDVPAIYAYDADLLVNGTSPANLSLEIDQDSDFIVRRVTGLETVADKIYLRRGIAQWASAPVHFLYDYAVIPEKKYLAGSFIGFDLTTVAKAVNAGAPGEADAPYPQLIFQGVRRYSGIRPPVPTSTYAYNLFAFTYQMDITVNWLRFVDPVAGGSVNIPRIFIIPIQDFDFELCQISINRYDGVDCSSDLKLTLFNKDKTALFDKAVTIQFLMDNDNNNKYNGVFPAPPVVYPMGSEIQFDVSSLLTNTTTLPVVYSFSFMGMRRRRKI